MKWTLKAQLSSKFFQFKNKKIKPKIKSPQIFFQCYYNNAHKSIINDDDDNTNSCTFSMPVCKIWRKNNTKVKSIVLLKISWNWISFSRVFFRILNIFLNQIKTFKVSFFSDANVKVVGVIHYVIVFWHFLD